MEKDEQIEKLKKELEKVPFAITSLCQSRLWPKENYKEPVFSNH